MQERLQHHNFLVRYGLYGLSALLAVIVALIIVGVAHPARAYACPFFSPPDDGQSGCTYYISNGTINVESALANNQMSWNWPSGYGGASTAAGLINWVENGPNGLNNSSQEYQTGESSIINIMMGDIDEGNGSYTAGISAAQANESNWGNLVNEYAAAGQLQFNQILTCSQLDNLPGPGRLDTAILIGFGYDEFSYDDTDNSCTSHSYIVFRNQLGQIIAVIDETCGNFVGSLQPLPPVPPTASPSVKVYDATTGGSCTTAAPTSISVTAGDTVGFCTTVGLSNYSSPFTFVYTYAMLVNGSVIGGHTGCSPPSGSVITKATSPIPSYNPCVDTYATSSSTTNVCVLMSITAPSSAGAIVCATVTSSTEPFLQVKGGDVVAGSQFRNSSGVCPSTSTPPSGSTGGIYSWNTDASPYTTGAGSQFATQALGPITGFASGQGTSTNSGSGLSFSNSSASPSSGNFGGSFGYAPCAPKLPTASSGTLPAPSGGTITIPNGSVVVLYVNGNYTITNNIVYATGWNSPASIPSFELVATGNIYIAPGVTTLYGTYAAPNGTIYTCSTTGTYAGGAAGCGNSKTSATGQLQVYGSFIAKQIAFERTAGDLNTAGSPPAEVFNYGPALWLSGFAGGQFQGSTQYQFITSLPPVL